MKKKLAIIIFLIFLLLIFLFFHSKNSKEKTQNNTSNTNSNIDSMANNLTASYNGFLHTEGANLKNKNNEIIQLRGLSSHGIEWYFDVLTKENLETLKNDWKINVFRIAMYTDSNGQGYIFNSEENKQKVYQIVDICINLDMYVIVDWHILSDSNPQKYKNEAKEFFEEISKKYGNIPNIIYEICNEPNQNSVTWDKHIKPYAEEIIPIIRNNAPDSLIIVGTPDWCKKLQSAADNPLDFKNIVYACHFYSGTHKQELRNSIDYCIEKNIPIFISECGATTANGDGTLYTAEFSNWINYLNSKNISWVYWSFSNKNEGSAILESDYLDNSNTDNYNDTTNNINATTNTNSDNTITDSLNPDGNNTALKNINEHLTSSGIFIKSILQSY